MAAAQEGSPYEQRENLVYAEVHGVGLLMDVFTPTGPGNGLGIVDVASGAWYSDRGKINDHKQAMVYDIFCAKGYTVFAVRPGSVSKWQGQDMLAHVQQGIQYVKQHAEEYGGREFFVFPQNGPGIIAEEAFPQDTVPAGETPETYARQMRDRYFANIDGIGAEDTFYYGEADQDNPLDPQHYVIDLLDEFRAAGLLVLAIDYLTEPQAIDDFYTRARDHGWVPYCSIRDLSELVINETQPPD